MLEASRKKEITVRVIRDGLREPPDDDWASATPEERIEAVWTLTELCSPGTNLQKVNPNFTELLLAFNAHNLEY
jgi:hypothetical protein